jgi:hypothetical protein
MPDRRPPAKEFRGSPAKARPTYAEKLADVRWKRKRDEMLRRSNYTCCECGIPLVSGTMDLQVHHVVYISCLDPWDYPDELLLVVCDWHHKERQAVEQAIFVEVGKHLAGLDIYEMRRQPIYAFFEEDSTLNYLPLHMRELLRYERDRE